MRFRLLRGSWGTGRRPLRGRDVRGALAVLAVLALASMTTAVSAFGAEKPVTKPVNTAPPTISGKAQDGGVLKAKEGKWSGGGTMTYLIQWQRCEPGAECTNIATGPEYTAGYEDIGSTLRVLVTASNSAGSTEALSEQTGTVAAVAPKNTVLPSISGAAAEGPEEGQLLTVSSGSWSGTRASYYTYQWERCTPSKRCSEISGADEATYRVAAADVGETLRAVVTDVNLAGEKSATSATTLTVRHGPPAPIGYPSIRGSLREGGTLEADPGTWVGLAPIGYTDTWESCNAEHACSHATGTTYELGPGDVGNTVRLNVLAHNSLGSATASSVQTPPVLAGSADFVVGWGEDLRGQLGTLYKTNWEETPVLAEGESGVTAIAAGGSFSLDLHSDGTVTSSGAGYYGSIGDGGRKATWEQGKSHVSVSGLTGVTAVSAGAEYALALLEDGNVEAWGNNGYGTLGNGKGGFEKETGENQLLPKEVLALNGADVKSIASGGGSNFAVLANGTVKAWGHNNVGQLAVAWPKACEKRKTCEEEYVKKPSEEPERPEAKHKCFTEVGWELCAKTPQPVLQAGEGSADLEHVVRISAGFEAAYAVLDDGEVLSWGNDNRAQLGHKELEPGSHTSFTKPGPVMAGPTTPLTDVVAVAGGHDHAIALLANGSVVGWGANSTGALGELGGESCGKEKKTGGGTWPCDRYATPIRALEGIHVIAIAAGTGFSAALGSEGRVYTVGSNQYGELGNGSKCENEGGEMGYGGTCYSRRWTAIPGLEDVQAISANLKGLTALVGSHAAPPLPAITGEPGPESGPLSIKLGLALPNSELSNRLSVRVWEHPGAGEVAEGESEGEGEEGEGQEEGGGVPPTIVTKPVLRVIGYENGKKIVIKGEAAVGDSLETTSGNWSGTPPLTYEYRWLRCKGSTCTPVTSWAAGGEESKGEEFQLTEGDAGYTFEAEVSARHETEARGFEYSGLSEMIKAEGEGRNSKSEYVNLDGVNGYLLSELYENPLEPEQYEVRLSGGETIKGQKNRVMVVAP